MCSLYECVHAVEHIILSLCVCKYTAVFRMRHALAPNPLTPLIVGKEWRLVGVSVSPELQCWFTVHLAFVLSMNNNKT